MLETNQQSINNRSNLEVLQVSKSYAEESNLSEEISKSMVLKANIRSLNASMNESEVKFMHESSKGDSSFDQPIIQLNKIKDKYEV